MSEARRKRHMTRASSDAAQLLSAIAESQRAAIALHEIDDDDDLPGKVDDFVLIFPDSKMRVISNEFLRRACLVYFASKRFAPGLPAPQISGADIPSAEKLIAAMRDFLRTRNDESKVIPPPNWRTLAMKCVNALKFPLVFSNWRTRRKSGNDVCARVGQRLLGVAAGSAGLFLFVRLRHAFVLSVVTQAPLPVLSSGWSAQGVRQKSSSFIWRTPIFRVTRVSE